MLIMSRKLIRCHIKLILLFSSPEAVNNSEIKCRFVLWTAKWDFSSQY